MSVEGLAERTLLGVECDTKVDLLDIDGCFVEWKDKRVRVSPAQKLAWDSFWDYLELLAARLN